MRAFDRLGAGLLLALVAGVAQGGEVVRTDSRHLPPPRESGGSGRAQDRYPSRAQAPQVLVRSTEVWRSYGKIDRKLSDACGAGDFHEIMPMAYRAVFKDDTLGVAFGHGTNLHDPGKLADRGLIYLFRNAGTTGCLVLSRPNLDSRINPSR